MENKNKKSSTGSVEVYVTRDFFNSLISFLQFFIEADSENKYGEYAIRLKSTILRFSRKFNKDGEDIAVIHFYEDEAAILIKLLTIYINATEKTSADFYSQIGEKNNFTKRNDE